MSEIMPGSNPESVGEWQQGPNGWTRELPAQPDIASEASPTAQLGDWVQAEDGGWTREPAPATATAPESTAPEASVTSPEATPDQYNENMDLLKQSEMGVLLAEAYRSAVHLDPRLADIKIVPYDASERGAKGSAFARSADNAESGQHEIHVRLDDIDGALNLVESQLDSVPGLREILGEMMDVPGEELTPLQVHAFIMLHEMGHLVEFMDNEGNMPALRERQRKEKDALPLGELVVKELIPSGIISTSMILDPSSAGGQIVRDNWDRVSQDYGVSTIEELAEITNRAHRDMTSERFADNFAADVLSLEPNLYDQLGSADPSRYRNWYADQEAA